MRFRVAPGSKHKTGFFLDQRDNRKPLASFCAGRRVLDLCCNTGGFAVYAKALGGAEEVVGVDLDEQALALARQNAGLNQVARPLRAGRPVPLAARHDRPPGQRFDVVVLDPAKQTRDREEVDFALKRYLDMNRLALQAVAPGGIFLTCSCTGLVREGDFLETLRRAAWQAGRTPCRCCASRRGRGGSSLPAACAGRPLSQGGFLPASSDRCANRVAGAAIDRSRGDSGIRLDRESETCDGWIGSGFGHPCNRMVGFAHARAQSRPVSLRAWSPVLEDQRYMLHVTCDHCGKQMRAGEDRYVVKIEVFAAHDPAEITEADLEEDHMEAVSELLREMEESRGSRRGRAGLAPHPL